MGSMIATQLGSAWRAFVDVVTPPHCLMCHEPVTEPAALCLSCWQKLHMLEDPVCDVLGTPFTYDPGPGLVSAAALANPPPWDRARAAVAYDEASRQIVHALKYRDTAEAALLMARMMVRAGRKLLVEAEIILPVPLHRTRLWRRRFNQSALLGRRLAAATGVRFNPGLLQRVKATRPQVGLHDGERQKNVAKAFAVKGEQALQLQGKHVVLVDDVMTTGATAGACARVLKTAGARQVDVLCFALVLKPAALHI